MLKLIGKDTYERVWELSDEPKEKWPVFVLKKLTAGEVNQMDDQLTTMSGTPGQTRLSLLVGTGRRLKIRYALVDWRNVILEDDKPAPCTDANKEKLPAEIQTWLEENIDEVNALRGLGKEERKNF